ncbi:MAG: hypothetical protein NC825_00160 [Candidatus Omnitrophica bacterium]|nr:hypothetical protein [Candidatus Omnitrophota bacterium]
MDLNPSQSPFTKGGIEGGSRRNVEYYITILLIFLSVHPHIPFCKVENMGISGGDERKYKKDN